MQTKIMKLIPDQMLSIVFRISALLTKPSSLETVLDSIMESVTEGLGFNRVALYLINNEKQKLECQCIRGFSFEHEDLARRKPYSLKRHDCLETKVALSGNPILVKDVHLDPILTDLDHIVTRRIGRGCILYVPLKVKGKTIGILGVDKKPGEPEINENEFASLSIFANFASIIIENSKLYDSLLNEKKFSENVLNSSISGILTADVNGRITSLNPAAEELLGFRKKDILEKNIGEVFVSIPEMEQMLNKTLSNGENITGRECTLKKDGTRNLILNISSSPIIEDSGDLIGILFLMQDITKERERDEYLHRVNHLVSLGELAAGVAHEIRNPLTGIGVVLDILKSRSRLVKTDSELLDEAALEIERLEKLVSDLLDFARPRRFNFEFVDINEIIKSIYSLINDQCNNQRIRLQVRYGETLPKCCMDYERIRQGLLNIVINAIQAMPKGGDLMIETALETGQESGEERQIEVMIKDTGSGIPSAIRDRIFNPFFTTHHEGTGLGLSITHSIIKEHQGAIRFESEAGKGTRFIVSLPLESSNAGRGKINA